MKNIHKYILIFTFCILYTGYINAQLKVFYVDDAITDTIYNIKKTKQQQIDFCFPGFNVHKASQKAIPVNFQDSNIFTINIKNGISSKKWIDRLTLFCRVYTDNIKNLKITFLYNNCYLDIAEIAYREDGFQWLIEEDLSSDFIDTVPDALSFEISKKEENKPSKIFIGDLWIGKKIDVKKVMPNAMFMQQPFDNNYFFDEKNYNKNNYNSFGLFTQYPQNYYDEAFATFLEVESTLDERQTIIQILHSSIINYPFYTEKKLYKHEIETAYKKVSQKALACSDMCEFINVLNNFLYITFSDPHFNIKNYDCESTDIARGPIRLFPIGEKYKVAAVFDEELVEKIPLDSQVYSIDAITVTDVDKEGLNRNSYSKIVNRNNVNSKLFKHVGDSVVLKYTKVENDSVFELKYALKSKYKVPSNFRLAHCSFKIINNTAAYFKFNSILRDIPLAFATHIDEINSYKNLILDLRENTGGESEEGARLLSYLIPKDFVFTKTINRATGDIDSTIVKSDKCFAYREDGNIILLVDETTASAAELFTYILKKNRKNVTIIGRNKTMGTIIPTYFLKLPGSNTTIQMNSASPVKYVFDYEIEDIGIAPDNLVETTTVYDLQPYNDNVLNEALDFLKTQKEHIASE